MKLSRRSAPALIAFALLALLLPAETALAVKRDVIRGLQGDFAGRTYQLRVDLQGTNYLSVPNVMTDEGVRYKGRQFPVLFRRMEMVYLDRISNDGGKSVALTIYRNKEDAGQIRGAIPGPPMNPGAAPSETTLGSFARDFSTTVILQLSAEKSDTAGQREEILQLLRRVFYVKEEPTFEEKEAFIRGHRDMPIPKLMQLTGLPEDVVRQIRDQEVAAPPEAKTPK